MAISAVVVAGLSAWFAINSSIVSRRWFTVTFACSSRHSFRSIRLAHEAHVMPVSSSSTAWAEGAPWARRAAGCRDVAGPPEVTGKVTILRFVAETSKLTERVVKLAGETVEPLQTRASLNAERINTLVA